MPASGARSGTKPSRAQRGAGDGRISLGIALACGHLSQEPPVAAFATGRRLYRCPHCGGLQEAATRGTAARATRTTAAPPDAFINAEREG